MRTSSATARGFTLDSGKRQCPKCDELRAELKLWTLHSEHLLQQGRKALNSQWLVKQQAWIREREELLQLLQKHGISVPPKWATHSSNEVSFASPSSGVSSEETPLPPPQASSSSSSSSCAQDTTYQNLLSAISGSLPAAANTPPSLARALQFEQPTTQPAKAIRMEGCSEKPIEDQPDSEQQRLQSIQKLYKLTHDASVWLAEKEAQWDRERESLKQQIKALTDSLQKKESEWSQERQDWKSRVDQLKQKAQASPTQPPQSSSTSQYLPVLQCAGLDRSYQLSCFQSPPVTRAVVSSSHLSPQPFSPQLPQPSPTRSPNEQAMQVSFQNILQWMSVHEQLNEHLESLLERERTLFSLQQQQQQLKSSP